MNISSLVGHVTELLSLVDGRASPADTLTSEFFRERRYLGSHDRRFISDVLFGIIRHRRFLEAILEGFEDAHPEGLSHDRSAHYLALYAAYAVTRLTHTVEHVTEELGSRWKVLRPHDDLQQFMAWVGNHADPASYHQDPRVRLGIQYSFQDWMVEAFSEIYGDRTRALLQALNESAPTTIRINTLKTNRESCSERLREEGIESSITSRSPVGLVLPKRFNRNNSTAFKGGWFELQDEGSQLISFLVHPRPGMVVIDACAGAGGKTLHLAELMNDTGELLAIDTEQRRLAELHHRIRRAGVTCVRTMMLGGIHPEDLRSKADIVLVDAPCSGTGTIRRNPSLKWETTEAKISGYANRQLDILNFNSPFVKQGGMLVYATCSLLKQENEDVVEEFLKMSPSFSECDITERSKKYGLSSHGMHVRLSPHELGTDGFFVAVMKRTGG